MSVLINADTSDGLKFTSDTSGEIKLQSAGTDTVTVKSDGKVGISTSSPSQLLEVGSESTSNNYIQVSAADNTQSGIKFRSDTSKTTGWDIGYEGNGNYLFFKNDVSGSVTERLRINGSGDVFIGTTSQLAGTSNTNIVSSNGWVLGLRNTANSSVINITNNSGTGTYTAMGFYNNGLSYSACGQISVSGSNTSYVTSSDYRLKQNVVPMSNSIDRLKQLKPSTWTWTQDGSHGEGFIAHEAQLIVPEAVTGIKDETEIFVDTDGIEKTRPKYQGIDQSKLVPLLTSALQEAITKIENLETRIQALESN